MTTDDLRQRLADRLADTRRRGAEAFAAGDATGVESALAELRRAQSFILELAAWEEELVAPPGPPIPAPEISASATIEAPKPERPPPVEVALSAEPATEPAPPPPAKSAAVKRKLAKEREEFVEACRKLELRGRASMDAAEVAQLKALACLGRAIDEEASRGPGIDYDVQDLNKQLLSRFAKASAEKFFGFDFRSFRLDPDLWRRLGEAYGLFPHSIEAVEWAEQDEDMPVEVRRRMLLMAAACDSLLFRLLFEGAHARDVQQEHLHARLMALQARHDLGEIPWWRHQGPLRKTEGELRHEAEQLAAYLKDQRQQAARRAERANALAEVVQVLETANRDRFAERLNGAVAQVLDAGVPPTSLELRAILMPYRVYLTPGQNKKIKRLCDALNEAAAKAERGPDEADEEDVPVDDAHQARLRAVRKLLKGKTVLFVGGNKGQTLRRAELEKTLGLKELLWPECEEHSDLSLFAGPLKKADVVCLLVRFSRHAYQVVLEDAKKMGKDVAVVPAGLSEVRVTFDLYQQLVAKGQTATGGKA